MIKLCYSVFVCIKGALYHIQSEAAHLIEIFSKSQHGQAQYPNWRNCNFLKRLNCVTNTIINKALRYYPASICMWNPCG